MRRYVHFLTFAVVLMFSRSVSSDPLPVVLELFTSQSCSSCPPADRLLEALAGNPGVIALGCHVDYWNHLDWVDTLTQEECASRQARYQQAFRAKGVYTPQMVVNGSREAVGGDGRAIEGHIAAERGKLMSLSVALQGNVVRIAFPEDAEAGLRLDLEAILVGRTETVTIERGENAGSRVAYVNPVRRFVRLGFWSSGEGVLERAITELDKGDVSLVVLGRKAEDRRISAAGDWRR